MDQNDGPKEGDVILAVATVGEVKEEEETVASDGTSASVGWSRSYASNYDSIFGKKKNTDLN